MTTDSIPTHASGIARRSMTVALMQLHVSSLIELASHLGFGDSSSARNLREVVALERHFKSPKVFKVVFAAWQHMLADLIAEGVEHETIFTTLEI